MFVVTNICRDKTFCRKHVFVATKMILAAAPANDMGAVTESAGRREHFSSLRWYLSARKSPFAHVLTVLLNFRFKSGLAVFDYAADKM